MTPFFKCFGDDLVAYLSLSLRLIIQRINRGIFYWMGPSTGDFERAEKNCSELSLRRVFSRPPSVVGVRQRCFMDVRT